MIYFLVVIAGIGLLVRSADVFVDQAAALAKRFKASDFLIGFTVVAFGTSLPETVSVIFAAAEGHNQLVISNIIGSNIVNLCLIIGLVALFNQFKIKDRDVNINIPLNMAALMAFWALASYTGFKLEWPAGISMLLVFLILSILSKDYNHISRRVGNYVDFSAGVLVVSLITLIVSGKVVVDQTVNLATVAGIKEGVLGYFLLAVGTSLPELVATWTAVRKKDDDLGLGNILGSNIFNLLVVLGVSTFVTPLQLTNYKTEMVFLTGVTLAVYVAAIVGKKYFFSRKEGVLLVGLYILFIIFQLTR